jgi:hypothetical protein
VDMIQVINAIVYVLWIMISLEGFAHQLK